MIEPILSKRIPRSRAIDPAGAMPDCSGLARKVVAVLLAAQYVFDGIRGSFGL